MAESDLQWVVTGYALTFGGFLLLRRPRQRICSAAAAS